MTKPKYPADFLERLAAVKNKRAKALIDRILKNGFVTTEELKEIGYNHPPRAARDVRELGIPLITFYSGRSSDGRRMASYAFRDPDQLREKSGRINFPKNFKAKLIEHSGSVCNICSGHFEERYLQIDHRVPYEVAGDVNADTRTNAEFQLLDGSCNRAKSWSCEHCENWINAKDADTCKTCYWATPEEYTHVATKEVRRLDLIWTAGEIMKYEKLKEHAKKHGISVRELAKILLEKASH